MTTQSLTLAVLASLAFAYPAGAADLAACQSAIEVSSKLDRIPARPPIAQLEAEFYAEQRPRLEALAREYPDDILVQRRLVAFLRDAVRPSRSARLALPEKYKLLRDSAPDSVIASYLYAEAAADAYPHFAIPEFEAIANSRPDFPWPHLALAELFSKPSFADNRKATLHARRFLDLCPDRLEGYSLLRALELSPEEAFSRSIALRRIVDRQPWEVRLQWLPLVWDLELKATTGEQRETEIPRISKEVAEVIALARADRREWFEAIEAGARITGDAEREKWAAGELSRRRARTPLEQFHAEALSWIHEHSLPRNAPWEDVQDYYRGLLAASLRWTEAWPLVEEAWVLRLEAAAGLDEISKEDAARIADAALDARERALDAHYRPELRYGIARLLLRSGIRLDEVEELAAAPLRELTERHPKFNRPLPPQQRALMEASRHGILQGDIWESNFLLGELGWIRKSSDEMARALGLLIVERLALVEPNPNNSLEMRRYARWQTQFHLTQARSLALAGDPDGAFQAYLKAVESRPVFDVRGIDGVGCFAELVVEEARRFGTSIGRSDMASNQNLGGQTGSRIVSTKDKAPDWQTVSYALPPFSLVDFKGRKWSNPPFESPAVVVVWRSDQLPFGRKLQAIHESLSGDTPMLVMAVGGNPSVFQQAMDREGWTFPVAEASETVAGRLRLSMISSVYLVDAEGVVRRRTALPFGAAGRWGPSIKDELQGLER